MDPAEFPILAWRWKALNLVARGGLATKETDDFALRLYVTFDLDPDRLSLADRMRISLARAFWGTKLPLAALCYVWDGQAPRGTFAPNAYTDRVRMVVADSGTAALGRWVEHERDVAADFRQVRLHFEACGYVLGKRLGISLERGIFHLQFVFRL